MKTFTLRQSILCKLCDHLARQYSYQHRSRLLRQLDTVLHCRIQIDHSSLFLRDSFELQDMDHSEERHSLELAARTFRESELEFLFYVENIFN